jgi:Flp pilus assembly protein TadG
MSAMKWPRIFTDERGVSAVEFAAVSPVLAIVIAGMVDGWSYQSSILETRAAVQAAAKYVLEGGADDETARSVALSAWENRPSDGDVTVNRYCACGETVSVCSSLCIDTEKAPATFVDIKASMSWSGAFQNDWLPVEKSVVEQQVIRVR